MLLIAQNHLQLIVEVGVMLFVTLVFCLNLIPLSLSVVTFLSLFIMGGFTLLFGADISPVWTDSASWNSNSFCSAEGNEGIGCGYTAA